MDLTTVISTVPCARCGDSVAVTHFAHAKAESLSPKYHLGCAMQEAGT